MNSTFLVPGFTTIIESNNILSEFLKDIEGDQIPNSNEFSSPSLFSESFISKSKSVKGPNEVTNHEKKKNQNTPKSIKHLSIHAHREMKTGSSQHGRFGKFCSKVKANILYRFHKEEERVEEDESELVKPELQLIDYTSPDAYQKFSLRRMYTVERAVSRRPTSMFSRRFSSRSDNPLFGNINTISGLSGQANGRYSISRVPARQLSQISISSVIIPGTNEIQIRRDSLLRVERCLTQASLLRMNREQRHETTALEDGETSSSPYLSSSSLDHQSMFTVEEHFVEDEMGERAMEREVGERGMEGEMEEEEANLETTQDTAVNEQETTSSANTNAIRAGSGSNSDGSSTCSSSYCSILQSPLYMLKSISDG